MEDKKLRASDFFASGDLQEVEKSFSEALQNLSAGQSTELFDLSNTLAFSAQAKQQIEVLFGAADDSLSGKLKSYAQEDTQPEAQHVDTSFLEKALEKVDKATQIQGPQKLKEIHVPQHVGQTIESEATSPVFHDINPAKRALVFLIDFAIQVLIALALVMKFETAISLKEAYSNIFTFRVILFQVVFILPVVVPAYLLLSTVLFGVSIGERLAGLQLRTTGAGLPKLPHFFVRIACGFPTLLTGGLIVTSRPLNDRLARTNLVAR